MASVYDENPGHMLRMTYYLIISQLKCDGFDDTAAELQRLYLEKMGNLLRDVAAADSLLRIIVANRASSDSLLSAKKSMDDAYTSSIPSSSVGRVSQPPQILSKAFPESLLGLSPTKRNITVHPRQRRPKSSIEGNDFIEIDHPETGNITPGSEASAQNDSALYLELKKISQDLEMKKENASVDSSSNKNLIQSDEECSDSWFSETEPDPAPRREYEELAPACQDGTISPRSDVMAPQLDSDTSNRRHNSFAQFKHHSSPISNAPITENKPRSYEFIDSETLADSVASSCSSNALTPVAPGPSVKIEAAPVSYGSHVLNQEQFGSSTEGQPHTILCTPTTDVSRPTTYTPSAHLVNDEPDLLTLNREERNSVLSILREGFKVQPNFEKRVRGVIPRAAASAMEEVLYAIFAQFTHQFIEFEQGRRYPKVKLHSSYMGVENENILDTLDSIIPDSSFESQD